jgi:hypothetical protein
MLQEEEEQEEIRKETEENIIEENIFPDLLLNDHMDDLQSTTSSILSNLRDHEENVFR